jgi:hypothetical protein
MNPGECPSVMELLALRETNEPQTVADHVATCLRCRARVRALSLAAVEGIPDAPTPAVLLQGQARASAHRPAELRTGQVWIAAPEPDTDVQEVVVVIGRAPAAELVIVAPTSTALEEAGETDLIVEDSPAGYPHLIEVWNHGVVWPTQLREYVGRFDRMVREDVVGVYRWLSGAGPAVTPKTPVGPAISSRSDERLVHRALRQDHMRPLWAAADRHLGAETQDESATRGQATPGRTLGLALGELLQGPEWDEPSLLDASGASADALHRMRADRLELTDRSDVVEVGKVLRVVDFDDPLGLVRATLERSPGGLHRAPEHLGRLAARSRAEVSDQQRARDVYRNVGDVDESAEGRQAAVHAYLRDLETELDATE